MNKRLIATVASALISCAVFFTAFYDRTPKVASDFSGWPIEINDVIRSIAKSTDCKIEIQNEFNHKIPGGPASGCSLLVRRRSDDRPKDALSAGASAIIQALEEKGCRVISTKATSCKTDFRFAYVGASTHGSITLKALGYKEGVQLIIDLLENIPNDTVTSSQTK